MFSALNKIWPAYTKGKIVSLMQKCTILAKFKVWITFNLVKYGSQLEKIRKFRLVLSSGGHETGSTAKKWLHLIQPNQDPTYIFFCVRGHGYV